MHLDLEVCLQSLLNMPELFHDDVLHFQVEQRHQVLKVVHVSCSSITRFLRLFSSALMEGTLSSAKPFWPMFVTCCIWGGLYIDEVKHTMHALQLAKLQLLVCIGAAGAIHGDRGVYHLLL